MLMVGPGGVAGNSFHLSIANIDVSAGGSKGYAPSLLFQADAGAAAGTNLQFAITGVNEHPTRTSRGVSWRNNLCHVCVEGPETLVGFTRQYRARMVGAAVVLGMMRAAGMSSVYSRNRPCPSQLSSRGCSTIEVQCVSSKREGIPTSYLIMVRAAGMSSIYRGRVVGAAQLSSRRVFAVHQGFPARAGTHCQPVAIRIPHRLSFGGLGRGYREGNIERGRR